jgi:hypothetical protein
MRIYFPALGLLLALSALADTGLKNEIRNQGLNIGDVSAWDLYDGLMGIPYMLVEKETRTFRANISIAPIGKSDHQIPGKFFEQTEGEYRTGRLKFLETREGSLIKFEKSEHANLDSQTRAHVFAYEYELNGKPFYEQSRYVFCASGTSWLIQGLSSADKKARDELTRKLGSLRCMK